MINMSLLRPDDITPETICNGYRSLFSNPTVLGDSLVNYLLKGWMPGSSGQALVKGDLFAAATSTARSEIDNIGRYGLFLALHGHPDALGSQERMYRWSRHGGLNARMEQTL